MKHTPSGPNTLSKISLGTIAMLLSACASVQSPPADIATKHVAAPERFAGAEDTPAAEQVDIAASGWIAQLNDPVLESLVHEAWEHNPDLYSAAARFEEAAARLRVAASFLAPALDATGNAAHTEYDGPADDDSFSVGARVSWELDLWGKLGSDRAAARSAAQATGLDYLQARHSLAASVALGYYTLVAAKEQLRIDELLLEAEEFTAITTEQRVDAGLGTTLDNDLAQSSLELARASVQSDLNAIREASRALEILLGRYPGAELDNAPDTLPTIDPAPVALGVPSGLLERRPDIRSAELAVNAAYYSVRSANAARLPTLTLSADARALFDPSEFMSTVAADILAPVFNAGRLESQEAIATAQQRQSLGAFAAAALNAFGEVETALTTERSLRLRESNLRIASQRLVRASEAAINRYDEGLLPILDLQQIRRSDYAARSQLLSVRHELVRQRINLYLALGGPVTDPATTDPSAPERDELIDRSSVDPDNAPISGELMVGTKTTEPKNTNNSTRSSETNHDGL